MRQRFFQVARVGAVFALAALTLTACAAGASEASSTEPATAQSPVPTVSAETEVDRGDVVVKTDENDDPIVITDAYGSYQKITIRPDAKIMSLDPTQLEASVAEAGWSDDDVASAQRWLGTFIGEEFFDSIAVDGVTGWDEWKTTRASLFIAPEWYVMLDEPGDDSERPPIILNNPNVSSLSLVRDGLPRIATAEIGISTITSMVIGEEENLVFAGVASAQSRSTEDVLFQSYRDRNPDATDAVITEGEPLLVDGIDGGYLNTADFQFSMRKVAGAGWLITGYQVHNEATLK